MNRRSFLTLAAALPVTLAGVRAAQAMTPPVFATSAGVAIEGYDPVAYFTDAKPVKGSPDFAIEYDGATWHFATAENRDAFAADATAYAPQYGGYCAWAVANGYTAKIDPDAWTVHDGKLYLNFSRSVRRRWLRDIDGNIAKGDANWPSVLNA